MATVGLGQVPQEPQLHRPSQADCGSPLAPGCLQTLQGEVDPPWSSRAASSAKPTGQNCKFLWV